MGITAHQVSSVYQLRRPYFGHGPARGPRRRLLTAARGGRRRLLTAVRCRRSMDGQAGFDPARPAFFLWEAVTMYLDRASVEDTLQRISRPGA